MASNIVYENEEIHRSSENRRLLESQSSRASSQDSITTMTSEPKLLPQYITALCATIGALALGNILGYSSPAGLILTSNNTDSSIHLNRFQNGWFSSVSNLGSAIGCPLAGFAMDYFGRRGTLIYSIVPVLVGWILIRDSYIYIVRHPISILLCTNTSHKHALLFWFGFHCKKDEKTKVAAQNFAMLVIGRLITGIYGSFVSLTVNTYVAEFSSAHIRGTLGVGFQLMLTVGILFAYLMGVAFTNFRWIALVCAIFPCICSILMIFGKESPLYLLSKGRDKEAEISLKFFSFLGNDYDGISFEMEEMRKSLEERKRNKATLKDLKKPYILKPFLISMGLMFFQQFSGINAVLF
ncbi:Facilitated trehalose transporter Tret1, partial [Armadillidium nasatum]